MKFIKDSLILTVMVLLMVAAPAFGGDLHSLETAVKAWTSSDVSVPQFKYAFVDLNDDGVEDAVALIAEREYCGTGGCPFVIFKGEAGLYKLVSSSTITREPILLLPEKHFGWHTLSVFVAGGGDDGGQVLMRFNGSKYPYNPSMQPRAPENLKDARKVLLEQR